MKEIVSFFVGQGGVQLSSAIWELLCAEHGVSLDGQLKLDETEFDNYSGIDRLFFVNRKNQALPRGLFIDLESSVIDEIRCGSYKQLFSESTLISGQEDSASIFSRGYFTQGRLYLNQILESFNTLAENCDSLQGFTFFHSLGGGTGSGLHSLLLEEIGGYTKTTRIDLGIYPSFPISPIIVEPYNSILSQHYTIDESDVTFSVDNEALFRLANRYLKKYNPSYCDINRIIARGFDILTSSLRFGQQSASIAELTHNLVPYPRIHFPTFSLAPLTTEDDLNHSVSTVHNLTKEGLSNKYQLLNCDPTEGKYMSCCFMYRGSVQSGEVYESIRKLKVSENLKFVDWCPTGIKVVLCQRPPITIIRSGMGAADRIISIISNNSAITDPMLHNTFRFQVLFQKRAFVHWYVGEGMEEDEFKDALENIACLIKDYEECSLSNRILDDQYFEPDGRGDLTKTEKTDNTTEVTKNSDEMNKNKGNEYNKVEEDKYMNETENKDGNDNMKKEENDNFRNGNFDNDNDNHSPTIGNDFNSDLNKNDVILSEFSEIDDNQYETVKKDTKLKNNYNNNQMSSNRYTNSITIPMNLRKSRYC